MLSSLFSIYFPFFFNNQIITILGRSNFSIRPSRFSPGRSVHNHMPSLSPPGCISLSPSRSSNCTSLSPGRGACVTPSTHHHVFPFTSLSSLPPIIPHSSNSIHHPRFSVHQSKSAVHQSKSAVHQQKSAVFNKKSVGQDKISSGMVTYW